MQALLRTFHEIRAGHYLTAPILSKMKTHSVQGSGTNSRSSHVGNFRQGKIFECRGRLVASVDFFLQSLLVFLSHFDELAEEQPGARTPFLLDWTMKVSALC